jgi:hypothetical protein
VLRFDLIDSGIEQLLLGIEDIKRGARAYL